MPVTGQSGAPLAGQLASGVFLMEPAIQNLDFLRQLIAETRKPESVDMIKLRMLQGTGMGMNDLPTKKGDE